MNNTVDTMTEMKDQLETMIDRASIDTVLELIETICSEKAEHVSENWQDDMLARRWTRLAKRIGL